MCMGVVDANPVLFSAGVLGSLIASNAIICKQVDVSAMIVLLTSMPH